MHHYKIDEIELRRAIHSIDNILEFDEKPEIKAHIVQGIQKSKNFGGYKNIFLSYYALCIKGNLKIALKQVQIALAKSPSDGYLIAVGAQLIASRDVEKASQLLSRSLEQLEYELHYTISLGKLLMDLKKYKEALKYFDMVFEFEVNEYSTLINKAICLSKIGSPERAEGYYKRALEIKKTAKAYLNLAITYNKLKMFEEAIGTAEEALQYFPNNAKILREKASALSDKDTEKHGSKFQKDAIKTFEDSLKIDPNDHLTLRNLGIAYYRKNMLIEAFHSFYVAYTIEQGTCLKNDVSFVYSLLNDDQKRQVGADVKIDLNNRGSIEGFIETARRIFKSDITEFYRSKIEFENNLELFISAGSLIDPSCNMFLCLRRWNSYTPSIPLDDKEKSIGGGYFFFHNSVGTVVDPGYNFIENFIKAGCRLQDIDNIIITHAHNDHTMDFESLLSLFFQINRKCSYPKKINLYLNLGSMLKFGSIIDFKSQDIINEIICINPGEKYIIDKHESLLTVLPAYHHEVVTKYKAVGLHFNFKFGNEFRRVILTSDTGLYPLRESNDDNDNRINVGREIYKQYKNILGDKYEKIDLLITHLGSLGESELLNRIYSPEAKDWFEYTKLYENHLGVLGVLLMIKNVAPELALISEFGEELKSFREPLTEIVRTILAPDQRKILPADTAFIYYFESKKIYCPIKKEMTDVDKIFSTYFNNTFYYSSVPSSELTNDQKQQLKDNKNFPYYKN